MEDDFDEFMIEEDEGENGKRWLEKNESRMIELNDNNLVMANKNRVMPEIKIVEKIVFVTEMRNTTDV